VCVAADKKNTDLFLILLEKLRAKYPEAQRIHLVLDNYVIHSSRKAENYLEQRHGLFELHFLPPYSPNDNKIERLWRDLHANVTRNHRCRTIEDLMRKVRRWLAAEARHRAHHQRPGSSRHSISKKAA